MLDLGRFQLIIGAARAKNRRTETFQPHGSELNMKSTVYCDFMFVYY
jgi:hypothetical protein